MKNWEFSQINDMTGFANGARFTDAEEVRQYFTLEAMKEIFGGDYDLTQDDLNDMAEEVIRQKWHWEN